MAISRDPVTSPDRRNRRVPTGRAIPDPIVTLAAALPQAIERSDIGVHFQPQVRMADDRITGVEALARWDHPLLGMVDADMLFAAADHAGLGGSLSKHIQGIALTEAAGWPPSLTALDLSLNVTADDLADRHFASSLLERVAQRGVAPARLCVEVTESAPIADLASAAEALQQLRDEGVRVALDDVGAGYAGFAYLKALPFDRFKIDKSMTADLVKSAKVRAIVRGMIALARALELEVIAEGVETKGQRDCLAAEQCDAYQGFLCAGALDTSALTRLVEDRLGRS